MSSIGKTWTLTPEQRANQSRAARNRFASGSNNPIHEDAVKAAAAEGRRRAKDVLRLSAPVCQIEWCLDIVVRGPGGWGDPTSIYCRVHNAMNKRAIVYGTTLLVVAQRFIDVDKKCEICRVDLEFTSPDRDRAMNMDHDHATGEFRGILCRRCNSTLGYIRENPVTARRLAKYIERRV